MTSAERHARLLKHPGVATPLTAGGLHIAAGSGAMLIDDSGTANAIGAISLALGVAGLATAGVVALQNEPECPTKSANSPSWRFQPL